MFSKYYYKNKTTKKAEKRYTNINHIKKQQLLQNLNAILV